MSFFPGVSGVVPVVSRLFFPALLSFNYLPRACLLPFIRRSSYLALEPYKGGPEERSVDPSTSSYCTPGRVGECVQGFQGSVFSVWRRGQRRYQFLTSAYYVRIMVRTWSI